ncbi:uncharacterized protein N7477_007151 [Penicillium maclennaniae]|uniref:uncharacterized protein n=1 Tax=Penicillium maclennaniae TaxID=1343394 RepID=UPI00254136B2|nr:uncharacterized protein N7477_007151 [Penicillium maclennaniae]KAJ5668581.1 hypothetical protein N7477_007151 [Penicillium maclennaniae]
MNAPPGFGYPPGVSLAPTGSQDSPTAANFGSNNPFRNRALSPANGSTTSARPERPRSTNPFLDETDALSPQSAPGMSTGAALFSPVEKQDMTSHTRELFENLSMKPAPAPVPAQTMNSARPAPDASKMRPARTDRLDRPDRSDRTRTSRERSSGRPAESKSKDPFDIFADPPKSGPREATSRRPRRNSESSVMDRSSKLFDDDDDKRRRERRREREARHRDGKSRSSRKDRRLDIIDKLDVTSIYGTGMFHHDGPFDACNPHRNRKGSKIAPMQAFPKNSSNMALGGAGPNNSNIDLNLFHGRMEEGYNDFASSGVQRSGTVSFDPLQRVEPVHGAESHGLGTSTFLDGAPASRAAMARRQSENEQQLAQGGGLQRKKSLAQRLRGKSSAREGGGYSYPAAPAMGSSHSASSRGNEKNPFFQDYDEEWDKKGSRIQESRLESEGGRMRSSSSPKQPTGLERKTTNDRYDDSKLSSPGGGFLNRMKSLRKPRPERPARRTSD